ncbi:MAG: hypothetical protein ACLGG7_06195 [Bacteriovoracia bacterium]
MRNLWSLLGVLVLVVSCATPAPTNLPVTPYQTSGVEQFFLPELPSWANGNVNAACMRDVSIRFLDHAPLEKLHALDFRQRVEVQTQFNRKWRERYSAETKSLSPQEEAVLLLETLEQVKGGLTELRYPSTGPIHLVWWDQLYLRANAPSWLAKLADEGTPIVLVSLCRDGLALEKWVAEQKLDELGLFYFGAESLAPYDADGSQRPGPVAPLNTFFSIDRSTIWVVGTAPSEFPAGYNIRNVEE